MAKVLQLSDDSGTTWYTLPGPSADFNTTADGIDDTILGQTFSSQEVGLISWDMSSPAYFKGSAGYNLDIKKIGTSTATTGEAFSLVSGKTYQINTASKEVWDRNNTITIYDNAVDVTDEVETFDYLFGKVTFKSTYTVNTPVTADLNYFPMATFGKGTSVSLTMSAEAVDNSDFQTVQANGGYKTFIPGLRSVSLDVDGIFDAAEDFKQDLADRNELILEIDPIGDTLNRARGFFKIVSANQSGDVGNVEEESVSFQLSVPDADITPFTWDIDATSTLDDSVQVAITAWDTEATIDAQYLYDGTNGHKGSVVVTEVSLSTSIDGMNEFSVSLQGTGALTDVP